MRKTLLFLCVMLCLSSAGLAADITGIWTGTVQPDGAPNGDSAILTLKQDGEKLTGTGGPNPTERFQVTGVVKDDEVTLEIRANEGRVFSVAMKVTGDQMTGRVEMRRNGQLGGTGSITLKREAAKTQN